MARRWPMPNPIATHVVTIARNYSVRRESRVFETGGLARPEWQTTDDKRPSEQPPFSSPLFIIRVSSHHQHHEVFPSNHTNLGKERCDEEAGLAVGKVVPRQEPKGNCRAACKRQEDLCRDDALWRVRVCVCACVCVCTCEMTQSVIRPIPTIKWQRFGRRGSWAVADHAHNNTKANQHTKKKKNRHEPRPG